MANKIKITSTFAATGIFLAITALAMQSMADVNEDEPSSVPTYAAGPVVEGEEEPEIPEPPLEEIPEVTSDIKIDMPLDKYKALMSGGEWIDRARGVLATECMKGLGYGFWYEELGNQDSGQVYLDTDRVNYFDPKKAAANGYPKPVQDGEQVDPVVASKHDTAKKNPKFAEAVAVFEGRPVDGKQLKDFETPSEKAAPAKGCRQVAADEIASGVTDVKSDPYDLSGQAKALAMQDSRYKAAGSRWQACMAKAGFVYPPDHFMARLDLRWSERPRSQEPSVEEKAVAAADADCQQKAAVVGTYKALRYAYERELMKDRTTELDESVTIFQSWVSNAKKAIE